MLKPHRLEPEPPWAGLFGPRRALFLYRLSLKWTKKNSFCCGWIQKIWFSDELKFLIQITRLEEISRKTHLPSTIDGQDFASIASIVKHPVRSILALSRWDSDLTATVLSSFDAGIVVDDTFSGSLLFPTSQNLTLARQIIIYVIDVITIKVISRPYHLTN